MAAPLSSDLNEGAFIGIDVGGTKIATGLILLPGPRICERRRVLTFANGHTDRTLAQIQEIVGDLVHVANGANQQVRAIGLGVCELVDKSGNLFSSNCLSWDALDLRTKLGTYGPVFIEADVRAAALAEALFGAGRGAEVFLYITVGTGISCSLVLDGKPFTGARGGTGTMASSALPRAASDTSGNQMPTLEDLASGPALVSRYHRLTGRRLQSAQEILALARNDDKDAQGILESGCETLGATVGWLVNVLDPERVIIGGGLGLGLNGSAHWEFLLEMIRKHIWAEPQKNLPIIPAETGEDAGWIGAAAAAHKAQRLSEELAGNEFTNRP